MKRSELESIFIMVKRPFCLLGNTQIDLKIRYKWLTDLFENYNKIFFFSLLSYCQRYISGWEVQRRNKEYLDKEYCIWSCQKEGLEKVSGSGGGEHAGAWRDRRGCYRDSVRWREMGTHDLLWERKVLFISLICFVFSKNSTYNKMFSNYKYDQSRLTSNFVLVRLHWTL